MSNTAEDRCGGSAATDSAASMENLTETDSFLTSLDPAEEYKMDNKQRGLALIFNQEHFTSQSSRDGTNADSYNLQKRLEKLNFKVKPYKDSTRKDVLDKIGEAAKADHSDADCFLLVFLSHGGNDGTNAYVYASDEKVSIQDITSMFKGDKCKSLVGKPKIFILQACRGHKYDDPVTACSDDDSIIEEVVEEASVIPTLPAGADFIMCYSATEGYVSVRNTVYGSWYIQDLCKLLQKYGDSLEFTDLLTLVNRKVSMRSVENERARGKKQIPCFTSMLTRKLYFRPKKQHFIFGDGTNADCNNLKTRLKELNFEVKAYSYSNEADVFNKISEAAKADHSDADCFLLVYLSHSENGGKKEIIQDITSMFKGDKCKSLVGKPKIFILQVSRGEMYDDPVTACDATDSELEMNKMMIPAGADFIICYSVAEGYSSHQDTTNGSWYIQDLCEMLQEYGDSLEFRELLTLVNRKVSMRSLKDQNDAREKKQIPCFASMLTKKLYFKPKK